MSKDWFRPEELRVARLARGLNLREAATLTGLTKETLSTLERGQRFPHAHTLRKIADAYGVSIEHFLYTGEELLTNLKRGEGRLVETEERRAALGEGDKGVGQGRIRRASTPRGSDLNMQRLAELRRSKGFSQRTLAKAAGISPSTIYELERGRHSTPHPGTAKKMADAMGVEVNDVLEALAAQSTRRVG